MSNLEEIAISGISGRFPASPNLATFKANLISANELVTMHSRWPTGNLPQKMGQITDLNKFDASFFQINPKLAKAHDPKLRKLLEIVYETVLDAGIQMDELSGHPIGVIVAISAEPKSETGLFALSAAIMANTISFVYDFKGPSYALDTACSSALYAIDQGVNLIRNGKAVSVIICAAQTHFQPDHTKELLKMGVLNVEGVSKSFANDRNGYVKSEAIVCILLQKLCNTRRIYATILNTGSNVDGFKVEGISHPSSESQVKLLEEVYKGIDRNLVTYVEAHGPGTVSGDRQEAEALGEFFMRRAERKQALKIGSVKSCTGHTETASGLVSLAKVLLSIQSGVIPGNRNYVEPADIPELRDGLLKVVTCNTPFEGGLIGVNCFGFGGANSHLVLKPYRVKNYKKVEPNHRLVVVRGRTEGSVLNFVNAAIESRTNCDFLTLLDQIFRRPVDGFPWRGYVLLNGPENRVEVGAIEKRPEIWYCFAGMGSQWPGMGRDLMQIPAFEASIRKSANVLEPKGIDLVRIVTEGDWSTFDNLINSFTAIVAVSLGLVDVLTAIGLKPDRIIGHSLGEISCGYADGSLTLEQAILVAHARGHVTQNLTLARGLMAAVGLSREACLPLLAGNVTLACDNSPDNVTIAGAEGDVQAMIGAFAKRQIFAKVVPTSNVAFHSAGIRAGKEPLLAILREIIPNGRRRSDKWLSSSVPKEAWGSDLAKHNSAEYHVNNYLNQVHFRQVLEEVPANAIVVEVSPRGLFQSILRRTLPAVPRFSLSDHQSTNNLKHLFTTLGKLFVAGGNFDLSHFYEYGVYPVAVNTPTIGNLLAWNHSDDWPVPSFDFCQNYGAKNIISIDNEPYLSGHQVNGKTLYPAAGYLTLVWENYAQSLSRDFKNVPVKFTNVKLHQPTFLKSGTNTTLIVNIFLASGNFEICSSEKVLVCSGKIEQTTKLQVEEPKELQANEKVMETKDFYKEYDLRGYTYSGVFQSIKKIGIDSRSGLVEWNQNWVPFIDGLFQVIAIFEQDSLWLPTDLQEVIIDPSGINLTNKFHYDDRTEVMQSGGVIIRGFGGQTVQQTSIGPEPTFQSLDFVPFHIKQKTLEYALRICLGIVIENVGCSPTIAVFDDQALIKLLQTSVSQNVSYSPQINVYEGNGSLEGDLVVLRDEKQVNQINATFVFVKTLSNTQSFANYIEIQRVEIDSGHFVLYKQKPEFGTHEIVLASNADFSWIGKLQTAVKQAQTKPNHRIYIVSNEPNSGLNGFWNSYQLEDNFYPLIRVVQAEKCPEPLTNWNFYQNQLDKDLTINYFERKEWGTLRLVPFDAQLKKPTLTFNPNKSYLVIGGFGGAGFQLANWLVQNGVRKLIINSPSGPKSGYHHFRLAKWRQANVDVIIDNTNTTTPSGVQHLLDISSKLAPIDGIFNSALVLKDANFIDLTVKEYEAVVNPKYTSMSHFDSFASDLTYFVCFSSLVASVGHEKQTNYGLANAAMESLCQNRLENGRHALALEWGPIGDVGFVSQFKQIKFLNASNQPIRSCLDCLGHLLECKQTKAVLGCCIFGQNEINVENEKRSVLETVLNCFGLKNTTNLGEDTKLASLGMDSLLTYEIQLVLSQEFAIKLGIKAIKALTVGELKCFEV